MGSVMYANPLNDHHRDLQRRDGGQYTPENTEIIEPVEHARRHGNYKERSESLDQLKMLFDGYKQIQKLRMKVNNQILAMERGTDKLDEIDKEYIDLILKNIKAYSSLDEKEQGDSHCGRYAFR